jgi:hypothetical protein
MLKFKQNDTSISLILTLTELATQASPDYYFVFTHVASKEAVTFTKLNADDESLFKTRYNKFTINPSVVFANKQTGEWHYKVYQNDINGVLLEQGKMILDRSTDFAYNIYDSDTSFKTYNG